MALTTPDNLRTPNSGDQYALVQDLGLLADSVQTALVRRANSYVGTSAQRIAFTTAPEGTEWRDTNGAKSKFVRQSGVWVDTNNIIFGTLGPPAAGISIENTVLLKDTRTGLARLSFIARRASGIAVTDSLGQIPVGFRPPATWVGNMQIAVAGSSGLRIDGTDGGMRPINLPSVQTTLWVDATWPFVA